MNIRLCIAKQSLTLNTLVSLKISSVLYSSGFSCEYYFQSPFLKNKDSVDMPLSCISPYDIIIIDMQDKMCIIHGKHPFITEDV